MLNRRWQLGLDVILLLHGRPKVINQHLKHLMIEHRLGLVRIHGDSETILFY